VSKCPTIPIASITTASATLWSRPDNEKGLLAGEAIPIVIRANMTVAIAPPSIIVSVAVKTGRVAAFTIR
jgi:hypothetical protein